MSETGRHRLFVYASLLPGERDHDLMGTAKRIGPATTAPGFRLVDLDVYGALVKSGHEVVVGDLYEVDSETRRNIDVRKEVPFLFQRATIELSDGTTAEAYLMRAEQVRGKRRLSPGDWRKRFAPRPRADNPWRRR